MGKVPDSRRALRTSKSLPITKKEGIRELARVAVFEFGHLFSRVLPRTESAVAAAGSDGMIRLFSATSGARTERVRLSAAFRKKPLWPHHLRGERGRPASPKTGLEPESLPEGVKVCQSGNSADAAQVHYAKRLCPVVGYRPSGIW